MNNGKTKEVKDAIADVYKAFLSQSNNPDYNDQLQAGVNVLGNDSGLWKVLATDNIQSVGDVQQAVSDFFESNPTITSGSDNTKTRLANLNVRLNNLVSASTPDSGTNSGSGTNDGTTIVSPLSGVVAVNVASNQEVSNLGLSTPTGNNPTASTGGNAPTVKDAIADVYKAFLSQSNNPDYNDQLQAGVNVLGNDSGLWKVLATDNIQSVGDVQQAVSDFFESNPTITSGSDNTKTRLANLNVRLNNLVSASTPDSVTSDSDLHYFNNNNVNVASNQEVSNLGLSTPTGNNPTASTVSFTNESATPTAADLEAAKQTAIGWITQNFGADNEVTHFNEKIKDAKDRNRIENIIGQALSYNNSTVGTGNDREKWKQSALQAISSAVANVDNTVANSGSGTNDGTTIAPPLSEGVAVNDTADNLNSAGRINASFENTLAASNRDMARMTGAERQEVKFEETVAKSKINVAQSGGITEQIMNLAPGKISATQAYDIYNKNKDLIAQEMGDKVYTMANGDLGLTNPGKQELSYNLTSQLKKSVEATASTSGTEEQLDVAKKAATKWIAKTYDSDTKLNSFNERIEDAKDINRIKTIVAQVSSFKNSGGTTSTYRENLQKQDALQAISSAVGLSKAPVAVAAVETGHNTSVSKNSSFASGWTDQQKKDFDKYITAMRKKNPTPIAAGGADLSTGQSNNAGWSGNSNGGIGGFSSMSGVPPKVGGSSFRSLKMR